MNNTLEEKQKIVQANSLGEILDLVNENDEIVGTIEREKANADPQFLHREVGVLLLYQDTETNTWKILLQKRSKHKLVSPGVWSIVAGHVSSGKHPEQVVYEELHEELGLTDIELTFFQKKLLKYDHESHFMNYYVGEYAGQEIIADELEIESYDFFSLSEIQDALENGQDINTKHLPVIKQVIAQYEEM